MGRAIKDFQSCLAIDPGYLNCKQHMATAYLIQGDHELATQYYEETLEENFHSTDDTFVAHYVHSGRRLTAVLIASTSIFANYAPIKDWISAIENPDQNHSARIARWRRFAESENYDECGLSAVIVALRLDHCYNSTADSALQSVWHPDAAYYRETLAFKDLVKRKLMTYWQKHGFPPQCRPLEDGDFECD
jgi:tetratricopeptide (TPR) repeat protein